MADYWLSRWLDHEQIETLDLARKRLAEPGFVEHLIFTGVSEIGNTCAIKTVPEAHHQLVAGSGLNIAGAFDCDSTACMKNRINQVLYRSWHYFDNVLVTGLNPRSAARKLIKDGDIAARGAILRHLEIVLYIREIGAEKLLVFADRPAYCLEHLQAHAHEAGIRGSIPDVAEELGQLLEREAHFLELGVTADGSIKYRLKFENADHVKIGTYDKRPMPSLEDLAGILSRGKARELIAQLIGDASFARANEASLGQAAKLDDMGLAVDGDRTTDRIDSRDVAIHLSLPVIDHLPMRDLLAFRDHEAADFHAFRAALKAAISEGLAAAQSSDRDPGSVAESVYEDILEPKLIELDRKVAHATKLFAKRSVAAASVGAITTTVGLLAFPPVAAAGLAVIVGGTLANYNEYLKEKKEIELSDLYFLWRLTEKAAAHA